MKPANWRVPSFGGWVAGELCPIVPVSTVMILGKHLGLLPLGKLC